MACSDDCLPVAPTRVERGSQRAVRPLLAVLTVHPHRPNQTPKASDPAVLTSRSMPELGWTPYASRGARRLEAREGGLRPTHLSSLGR